MGNVRVLAAASTAIFLAVSGCASTGDEGISKQGAGTVIGAVGGALLGSQIGGGSGRKIAMLAGAVAGGALGNWIGANLDERDRQALAVRTRQALETGQAVDWKSGHSGATATITPIATRTVSRDSTIIRSTKIASAPDLTVINRPYQALKSANLRAGPDTNAAKVGGFAAGQTFTALGRTDNDWIAVGRKGVTVGYVYAPLVAPATTKNQDNATDLDNITVAAAKDQGFDLDTLEPAAPVNEKIAVRTTCRTVAYNVKTASGEEKKTVDACQAADGAWQLG